MRAESDEWRRERGASRGARSRGTVTTAAMIATPLVPRGWQRAPRAVVGGGRRRWQPPRRRTRRGGGDSVVPDSPRSAIGATHHRGRAGRHRDRRAVRPVRVHRRPATDDRRRAGDRAAGLVRHGRSRPRGRPRRARRTVERAPTRRALGAAALTAWDLFLDPQMVGEGYWRWAAPGAYRGIPLDQLRRMVRHRPRRDADPRTDAAGRRSRRCRPRRRNRTAPDAALVGEYALMAVMETIGFARYFRDPVVAAIGGVGMLSASAVAAAIVRAAPGRDRRTADAGRSSSAAVSAGSPSPIRLAARRPRGDAVRTQRRGRRQARHAARATATRSTSARRWSRCPHVFDELFAGRPAPAARRPRSTSSGSTRSSGTTGATAATLTVVRRRRRDRRARSTAFSHGAGDAWRALRRPGPADLGRRRAHVLRRSDVEPAVARQAHAIADRPDRDRPVPDTATARPRSYFDDDRLVQWAGRYATYSGSSPFRAPATLACIPHIEARFGCWYPMGGLDTLRRCPRTASPSAPVSRSAPERRYARITADADQVTRRRPRRRHRGRAPTSWWRTSMPSISTPICSPTRSRVATRAPRASARRAASRSASAVRGLTPGIAAPQRVVLRRRPRRVRGDRARRARRRPDDLRLRLVGDRSDAGTRRV